MLQESRGGKLDLAHLCKWEYLALDTLLLLLDD